MTSSRRIPKLAALLVLALPTTLGVAPPAAAATPELSTNGSYAWAQQEVADTATPGFGAATLWYPTNASGLRGGIAIAPGFTNTRSAVAWYGPRLASHGFVVITFNTTTTLDNPASRGTQLLAALDYLTGSSAVKAQVDRTRLAVMGYSMGGGGALAAAKTRPSLKAAIPLAPWHTDKTWPEVTTPTLVIGAENDTTAPVANHAEPFYTSLPSAGDKAYLELNNATHSVPTSDNAEISTHALAWLKHFVDGDLTSDSVLCPGPGPSTTVEEYRSTCPF